MLELLLLKYYQIKKKLAKKRRTKAFTPTGSHARFLEVNPCSCYTQSSR